MLYSLSHAPGNPAKRSAYADIPNWASSEYRSPIAYLNFPGSKYDTAQEVVDALNGTNNNAKKALILAGMSDSIRKDPDQMGLITSICPEAIRHAHKSALTPELVENTLKQAPHVYNLLPRETQQEKYAINAYARGMQANGCIHIGCKDRRWTPSMTWEDKQLPVYQYELSKRCDLGQFYSPENYQHAYGQMIQNGEYRPIVRDETVDMRDQVMIRQYDQSAAYLHLAHIEFGDVPRMRAEYQMAEARAVVENIDIVCDRIANLSRIDSQCEEIEILAWALDAFEHPPAILGIEPNQEMVDFITQKAQDAEYAFYVNRGDELREKLEYLGSTNAAKAHWASRIDALMEMSSGHPEMGIDDETRTWWWQERGAYLQELRQADQLQEERGVRLVPSEEYLRLVELEKRQPEMRIDQQITMDDYIQSIGENR